MESTALASYRFSTLKNCHRTIRVHICTPNALQMQDALHGCHPMPSINGNGSVHYETLAAALGLHCSRILALHNTSGMAVMQKRLNIQTDLHNEFGILRILLIVLVLSIILKHLATDAKRLDASVHISSNICLHRIPGVCRGSILRKGKLIR